MEEYSLEFQYGDGTVVRKSMHREVQIWSQTSKRARRAEFRGNLLEHGTKDSTISSTYNEFAELLVGALKTTPETMLIKSAYVYILHMLDIVIP